MSPINNAYCFHRNHIQFENNSKQNIKQKFNMTYVTRFTQPLKPSLGNPPLYFNGGLAKRFS